MWGGYPQGGYPLFVFVSPIPQGGVVNRLSVAGLLLLAALLEVAGDALIRIALRENTWLGRGLLFLCGTVVLLAYGVTVNAPAWDFGRLLGIYVVFFFVVSQVISTVVFHQPPGRTGLLGGAFIVVGGLILVWP